VLPVGASHEDAAAAWLRCVASKQGQAAFANAKGALTGRVGAGNAFESSYQVAAGWSVAHDEVVPSLAGGVAAEPSWTIDVSSALDRFVRDRNVAVLRAALLAAEADN
jgi:glucose/mannose transport system substrate-binding protein